MVNSSEAQTTNILGTIFKGFPNSSRKKLKQEFNVKRNVYAQRGSVSGPHYENMPI